MLLSQIFPKSKDLLKTDEISVEIGKPEFGSKFFENR